jgi:hypothetical protein
VPGAPFNEIARRSPCSVQDARITRVARRTGGALFTESGRARVRSPVDAIDDASFPRSAASPVDVSAVVSCSDWASSGTHSPDSSAGEGTRGDARGAARGGVAMDRRSSDPESGALAGTCRGSSSPQSEKSRTRGALDSSGFPRASSRCPLRRPRRGFAAAQNRPRGSSRPASRVNAGTTCAPHSRRRATSGVLASCPRSRGCASTVLYVSVR